VVGRDTKTIRAAVKAAKPGTLIEVLPGRYRATPSHAST
jgi:hypothetical protein